MNNKIRTLLVDSDESLIEDVKKYFSSSTVVEVKFVAKDGQTAIDIVNQYHDQIDVVVINQILSQRDSSSVLLEISQKKYNIKTILTLQANMSFLLQNADIYGFDYALMKPYSIHDLEIIMEKLVNSTDYEDNQDTELEVQITKMLHTLGVPSHIKGYQYIRKGIIYIYTNPYIIGRITKELYPKIAEAFGTTASRVERAIRHAIEVSWNRGDYEYMEELFGHSVDYDKAKPTNSEFIATVADKLKLDMKSKSR